MITIEIRGNHGSGKTRLWDAILLRLDAMHEPPQGVAISTDRLSVFDARFETRREQAVRRLERLGADVGILVITSGPVIETTITVQGELTGGAVADVVTAIAVGLATSMDHA